MASSSMTILTVVASICPPEFLVDRLEDQIKEYKEAKLLNKSEAEIKKQFEALAPHCMMILTKISGSDPTTLLDDMDKVERARNLIDPSSH